MNWDIEYIENRHYIRVKYEGLFSVTEQTAAIEDLLSRQFWQPGLPILIDHRNLDFGNTNIDYPAGRQFSSKKRRPHRAGTNRRHYEIAFGFRSRTPV